MSIGDFHVPTTGPKALEQGQVGTLERKAGDLSPGTGLKSDKAAFVASAGSTLGTTAADVVKAKALAQFTPELSSRLVKEGFDLATVKGASDFLRHHHIALPGSEPRSGPEPLHLVGMRMAGVAAGEPLQDYAQRMAVAKDTLARNGNEWEVARGKLAKADPHAMANLVEFRKAVVDGHINDLREGANLKFTASSVGSLALTSDYDITFAAGGRMDDIDAMTLFNSSIERTFGAQPGHVFDTNIYVQDYVGVKENIVKDSVDEEGAPFKPAAVFGGSVEADQHVMSLMKMRRSMDQETWNTFSMESMVHSDGNKALENLYGEADALYLLSSDRLLQALTGKGKPADGVESKGVEGTGTLRDEMAAKQAGLDKELAAACTDPKATLKARNAIYTDIMTKTRELDAYARQLEKSDPEAAKGLHAQRSRLTGQAIFFASEAYHSAGAVRHVVAGMQGGGAEKLSLADLQASFMEQTGDARLHAKGDNEVQRAQAGAKYMTRMLDAIDRIDKGDFDFGLAPPTGDERVGKAANAREAARQALDTLVPATHRNGMDAGELSDILKYTLVGAKKGEVTVRMADAPRLSAALGKAGDLVPKPLRDKLQEGIVRALISRSDDDVAPIKIEGAAREAAVAAGNKLLAVGSDEIRGRMTLAAARFDAILQASMAPTEGTAVFANQDPRLGTAGSRDKPSEPAGVSLGSGKPAFSGEFGTVSLGQAKVETKDPRTS